MDFINELSQRNQALFVFGLLCLLGSVATGILSLTTNTEVWGINAYIKPFKFFISSVAFSWSMAWYLGYLDHPKTNMIYTWVVIAVLTFELVYITYKASIGELSHFNVSNPQNAFMFQLMGIAISIMTLFTLYIGVLFFTGTYASLPPSYLWGIRLGIICFVIFAFEGGLMGARLSHTVGGPDGETGLKLLNWSVKYGDLRVAHFLGMHALQLLPLIGFYLISSSKQIILVSILYTIICTAVLIQALLKLPLIKG